jgi:hypothetical protein
MKWNETQWNLFNLIPSNPSIFFSLQFGVYLMEWNLIIKYTNNGIEYLFHSTPLYSILFCFILFHQSKHSLKLWSILLGFVRVWILNGWISQLTIRVWQCHLYYPTSNLETKAAFSSTCHIANWMKSESYIGQLNSVNN